MSKTYWVGSQSYTFADDAPEDQILGWLRKNAKEAPKQDFNAAHRSPVNKPYGDTTPRKGMSLADVGEAAIQLGANIIPAVAPEGDPVTSGVLAGIHAGQRYAERRTANPNAAGAVQAGVGLVPIVGDPLADVAGPGIAVGATGRPPTREENARAVSGGAALTGMMVGPKVAGRLMRRSQTVTEAPRPEPAAPVPEAAPPERKFTLEEIQRINDEAAAELAKERAARPRGSVKHEPPIPPDAELPTLSREDMARVDADTARMMGKEPIRISPEPQRATPPAREVIGTAPTLAETGKVRMSGPDDPWGRAIPAILDDAGRAHVAPSHFEAAAELGLGTGENFKIDPARQGWVVDGKFLTLDDLDAFKGDLRAYLASQQPAAPTAPAAAPVPKPPVGEFGPNVEAARLAEWRQAPEETRSAALDTMAGGKTAREVSPDPQVQALLDDVGEPAQGVKGVAEPMSNQEGIDMGIGPNEYTPANKAEDVKYLETYDFGRQRTPPPEAPPPLSRGPGELVAMPPTKKPLVSTLAGKVYERLVPQIVDAIEDQGPIGKTELAPKMRASERFAASEYAPRRQNIESLAKGLSDEQLTRTREVMEQWDSQDLGANPQKVAELAGDPKVAQLATAMRQGYEFVREQALGHVDDFVPMQDYFTHVGEKPIGERDPVTNLTRYAGHEARNLTRQRNPDSQGPMGKQVLEAWKSYMYGSLRYIGELKEFGVGNRADLDAKIADYADRIQASGYDGDLVRQYASKALGGGQTSDKVMSRIADGMIYLEAATKPIFAPIRHFQQIRHDIAVFGGRNTLRGTIDAFTQRFGMSPEAARAVVESGAMIRNAAEDMIHSGSSGPVVSALRKFSNTMNWPVKQVDQFKAYVTANAAARHFGELVKLAHGESVPLWNKATGDLRTSKIVQQQAIDTLRRAGVDAGQTNSLEAFKAGQEKYMWQALQDTQKHTTSLGSPALAQTVWGRILYTFNRPQAFGTDFVVRHVIGPARSGNFGPLVRYSVASIIAYGGTEAAVHALRGKSEDDFVVKAVRGEATPAEAGKFAVDALAPHGMIPHFKFRGLGPVSNYALTHSGALGATLSDADSIAQAVQKRSFAPLLRTEGHIKTAKELADTLRGQ